MRGRLEKGFGQASPAIAAWAGEVYAPEDDVLRQIRDEPVGRPSGSDEPGGRDVVALHRVRRVHHHDQRSRVTTGGDAAHRLRHRDEGGGDPEQQRGRRDVPPQPWSSGQQAAERAGSANRLAARERRPYTMP